MHNPLPRFSGVIPPMVTPLRSYDQLDEGGLDHLVDHLIAGGVHGIFALGTTGEAPNLSYRLRREVIEATCRRADGRTPVLVGITDSSFVESVRLAHYAAECGADAVVLAPPFYFPAAQPELLEYLEAITQELPLPLLLYNMPAMTKITFDPATVLAAADMRGVVGLKDSSGDMGYLHRVMNLLRDRPEFSLLVGPEELLFESTLLGAHGGVSGGANIFPRLYVELFEAARRGDLARGRELHRAVLDVGAALYRVGSHPSSIIKGIKAALHVMGICQDTLTKPFNAFRAQEKAKVADHVKTLDARLNHLLKTRETFNPNANPAPRLESV